MSNSERAYLVYGLTRRHAARVRVLAATLLFCTLAIAQTRDAVAEPAPAQGFAVERLYPSAAGAGFFTTDALDYRPELGGALALMTSVAHRSLSVPSSNGAQPLALVNDRTFVNVGLAVAWTRFRFSLDFQAPVWTKGTSGVIHATSFAAPDVDLSSHPDTLGDARIGVDVRLVGRHQSAFRVGVSSQLYIPSGARDEYDTDDSYRALDRVLVAGDIGRRSLELFLLCGV